MPLTAALVRPVRPRRTTHRGSELVTNSDEPVVRWLGDLLPDRTMDPRWSSGLSILPSIKLPDGYSLEQMSKRDVSAVSARLAQWYPEIQAGSESPHLRAEFYLDQTQLFETTEERSILPVVIRHHADGVVALITFERNLLASTLSCRLGALAPEHRRATLALFGPQLLEQLGRALDAELLYYFASLRTRHQQLIAERCGFRLVGIVPGHDRCELAPGRVKRVHDALYAKLLVSSDDIELPPADSLTAHTRAVWSVLFE